MKNGPQVTAVVFNGVVPVARFRVVIRTTVENRFRIYIGIIIVGVVWILITAGVMYRMHFVSFCFFRLGFFPLLCIDSRQDPTSWTQA